MLAWGGWNPDTGGPNSGLCAIADNVLPTTMGTQNGKGVSYGPFPQLAIPSTSAALSGAPRGSISLTLDDGTYQVYFATGSTIERMSNTYTFTSIDTGRSVTSGDDVSFCHYGSFLLNTDTTDGFKAYNVQTPAGNNTVSGAPTARYVFSSNNVVFALDCNGNNRRMQSSDIGDYTAWASGGANGKTFEDSGALQCGVDLKNGVALIFQTSAIRIVQFGNAASPALYSLSKLADGRGSVGERSVVSFDGKSYFLDTDGFYMTDGQSITPIGAEKVNRWFLANVDNSKLATVQGAVDPKNKIIVWRFFSVNNSSTTIADRAICYDWQLDTWFTLTVNTAAFVRLATPGYVLDGMDSFGTLDQMIQIPLDDRFWQGGAPVFGALDNTFKFGSFSGTPMAYTLQSFTENGPVNELENDITPISDNPNSQISLGVQRQLSDSITWKTAVGRTRAGHVRLRGSGLNITYKATGTAGDVWTYENGVDYPGAADGGPV